MKFEKGNIIKHKAGGSTMMQGQSLVMGEPREQSEIWFSYHWEAIKATRRAVSLDSKLEVREEETDECLVCNRYRRSDQFSKSLLAIVICVFVIEYRVKQKAKRLEIWDESHPYHDRNEEPKKDKKFKNLFLCEKWRNIVDFSGRKTTQKYIKSVKKLYEWIDMRNGIAHGNPDEIKCFKISPTKALKCYDDITKAIFELNTALGLGKRKKNNESCKRMLLRQ